MATKKELRERLEAMEDAHVAALDLIANRLNAMDDRIEAMHGRMDAINAHMKNLVWLREKRGSVSWPVPYLPAEGPDEQE